MVLHILSWICSLDTQVGMLCSCMYESGAQWGSQCDSHIYGVSSYEVQ